MNIAGIASDGAKPGKAVYDRPRQLPLRLPALHGDDDCVPAKGESSQSDADELEFFHINAIMFVVQDIHVVSQFLLGHIYDMHDAEYDLCPAYRPGCDADDEVEENRDQRGGRRVRRWFDPRVLPVPDHPFHRRFDDGDGRRRHRYGDRDFRIESSLLKQFAVHDRIERVHLQS